MWIDSESGIPQLTAGGFMSLKEVDDMYRQLSASAIWCVADADDARDTLMQAADVAAS